ncbi:MAG TPA: PIG-L family deacetylase [Myxococcota bacterium]
MTLVVVSPHLDDAVLSVGAAIAARAGSERVVVVSVCTAVGGPGHRLQGAHDRVAEDRVATAVLGAHAVHLGLPDAPLRGISEDWWGLCDGDDVDAAFVATIADRLRPHLVDASDVWGPLAVGRHVDHRAVRAALDACGVVHARYEERPYARERGAVAAAWRGAVVVDSADGHDIDGRVAFLERIGAPRTIAAPTPLLVDDRGVRWRRERMVVTPTTRALRDRALRAYASQHGFVVGDVDDGGWPWDDDAEALWRPDVR